MARTGSVKATITATAPTRPRGLVDRIVTRLARPFVAEMIRQQREAEHAALKRQADTLSRQLGARVSLGSRY